VALAWTQAARADPTASRPVLIPELVHDTSLPLSSSAQTVSSSSQAGPVPLLPRLPGTGGGNLLGPIESFDGVANADNAPDRFAQPDAEGDVGPSRYVDWANASIAIYDKRGRRLVGPISGSAVWAGLGTDPSGAASLCETQNRGDPVVLYDQLDDRWVLSQFAWDTTGRLMRPPYVQCVAVSTGPDPAGSYYRYAYRLPGDLWNDYSKLGLWSSAFVVTDVATGPAGVVGAAALALDRAAMVGGRAAAAVYTLVRDAPPLLPVDFDGTGVESGALARPVGPALLVGLDARDRGAAADGIELWSFQPSFANVSASHITGPTFLPTESFESILCSEQLNCIRQPGPGPFLASLSDRLMFRAEYRRLSGMDAIALTHTVLDKTTARAALRWYELLDRGSGFHIGRWGTLAPAGDSDDRWVGSAALDRVGDLGLGFSVSSNDLFPSIGYTGIPADPAASPPGEGRLAVGGGAETDSTGHWGDYGSVTVDPVDGCTFWVTQEYYAVASDGAWRTRIGSFRFPGCGALPTISGGGSTPRDGERLNASPGSWRPELPDATFAYRWRRCDASGGACADVADATGRAYRLGPADVHATIRVVVAATGASGATASSLSLPVGPIAPQATAPLDLVVTSDRVPHATLGARVAVTLHVTNHGTGTATGLVLAATVPPVLALRADATDDRCSGAPRLVCDLGFLPAGGSTTVAIGATAAARGTATVVASVAGDQPDPDPTTNSVTATSVATAPPLLRVLRAPRASSRGKVVTVAARLAVDEQVALRLRVRTPSGSFIRLLPGTRLAGVVGARRALMLGAAVRRSGSFGVFARFRAGLPGAYRLLVRAVDSDRLHASIALPVRDLEVR
jgi:hypothetical protein